jgi:hypothetical protein
VLWAAVAGALPGRTASGQADGGGVRPEARFDVVAARATAVHGGLGLSAPLGTSLRLGGVVGLGAVVDDEARGRSEVSARADLLARFLVDPFLESRWAPYAGAGVSGRSEGGRRPRGYLLAVVGVEGSPIGSWLPSVELGFGGGVRFGIVLRRGARERP